MFQDKIFSYNSGMRGNLHTHKTLKTLESGQIQNRLEKKIWEDLDTNKPGSGLNLKMLMPENWNFSTENRGSCHSSHQEEYIDILLALISQYCAWLASGTLIFESGSYKPSKYTTSIIQSITYNCWLEMKLEDSVSSYSDIMLWSTSIYRVYDPLLTWSISLI